VEKLFIFSHGEKKKKIALTKPFALPPTHLKKKNNQPTNFNFMPKKDSYTEWSVSSYFLNYYFTIKNGWDLSFWSWVWLDPTPPCLSPTHEAKNI
jgi:hypothetical protein